MAEAETQKAGEDAAQRIAEWIRESSRAGRIMAEDEILDRLIDPPLVRPGTARHGNTERGRLRELVSHQRDLEEIAAGEMRCYYSSQFMTRAYAGILLQKRIGPLQLIAEVVRENSEVSQRPVPLESFTRHPFDLTSREIQDSLEAMTAAEGYSDIVRTATSASGIYLYSTRHLEPDHAAVLAEWLDVGQFDNP